jgi:cytoskeletal protein RodZ
VADISQIGQSLKKIRLEKGISLEQVQKKTKINPNILKTIEGDSISTLSPIYLRGFVKLYCQFLGVNPADYIPGYKETHEVVGGSCGLKAPGLGQEKSPTLMESAVSKLNSLRPPKRIKKAIIFALIIIGFWVLIFNLGNFISSRSRASFNVGLKAPKARVKVEARPLPKPLPKPAIAVPAPTIPTQQKKALPQEPNKKAETSEIRLALKTRANCLISVKIDGNLVFKRVLEKGRSESWQAKEKIELALGDASAVELVLNNQVIPALGRKGQALKNVLITKDGLTTSR